jgi:hypothetical protein
MSPPDDKLALVGPLESGAKLDEGKQNLLRKKSQTFLLLKLLGYAIAIVKS